MEQKIDTQPTKVHRNFTRHDIVFAWFSYISAYLLCRTFPITQNNFGGMLFVFMLFVFTAVFLKTKGSKFNCISVLSAISAITVSASLVLSSNSFIHFFAYIYSLSAYCYFLYTATGSSIKNGISDLLIIDWFKALFLMPFCSFEDFELFRGMFHGRTNKSAKLLIKLGTGVCVAIVPTVLVLSLLSYDEEFSELVIKIFNFEDFNIFSHFISLVFAVPIGMYLYGLYVSSVDNKQNNVLSLEQYEKITNKIRIAPIATVVTAVLPLLLIYVLFFISQWQYYVSGFTGILPENFSYAEYAREGFFQLCTVSVINLAVIILIIMLIKKEKAALVLLKVLTVIFSLFTLVLISTAIAKMVMYIDCYGLTQKRVYATWFMLVLAVLFVIIALSRFVTKISAVSLSATVLIVSFAGLALCNVDSLIAKYNVDRYINGTLNTVDVVSLSNLGDAAVPEMVRLAEYFDEKNGTDITSIKDEDVEHQIGTYGWLVKALLNIKTEFEASDNSIFSFTVNGAKAKAAMEQIGLIQ